MPPSSPLPSAASTTLAPLSSLLPIPIAPSKVPSAEQSVQKSTAMQALRRMQMDGWGRHEQIEGTWGVVPLRRLWLSPLWPVRYTDEEVRARVESLRPTIDGRRQQPRQLQPLIVTPARDPLPFEQGGTDGDLLILDGGLTFRAAAHAGMDELKVLIQPYTNAYQATLHSVTTKISHRQPTPEEIGRMIIALRVAHTLEVQSGKALAPFPKQEELGMLLGCRQETVSRWIRLATLPEATLQLVWSGQLSPSAAMELLPLSVEAQAVVIEEAQRALPAPEAPLPQRHVRAVAQQVVAGAHRRAKNTDAIAAPLGPLLPVTAAADEAPVGLWLAALNGQPAAVAAAWLIHDLQLVLDAIGADASEIQALRRALVTERIQAHVREVGPPR